MRSDIFSKTGLRNRIKEQREEIKRLKEQLAFEQNACQHNFDELEEANEEIEQYKKVLKNISEMNQVGFNPEYVIKRYSEYAKNALNGKFEV